MRTGKEIARDVTIRMVNNGELKLQYAKNMHGTYSRIADQYPEEDEWQEKRDGLAEAIDMLESK